jgi:hypothetical protein
LTTGDSSDPSSEIGGNCHCSNLINRTIECGKSIGRVISASKHSIVEKIMFEGSQVNRAARHTKLPRIFSDPAANTASPDGLSVIGLASQRASEILR